MTYGELLERLYELDPLELNQLVSVHVIDTDDVYLAKDICVAVEGDQSPLVLAVE